MSWAPSYITAPDILLDFDATLRALQFPAHTDTGRTPPVWFMGTDLETADEYINLAGGVQDGVVQWEQTGAIVGETFSVTIEIVSHVAGGTGPEALARVNTLAKVVQAGFRDTVTGLPTGVPSVNVVNYRPQSFDFTPVRLENQGWGYDAELVYRLETRI